MRLYPAIDLKDGKCVRLLKGDMMDATVYNNNALVQASAFHKMGFTYLHIVDLNGALSGKSVNKALVERIMQVVPLPIQLGGGIRDRATVEAWLKAGVDRVVLGTMPVKNFELVREVAAAYPGKIVVSIDAREGYATTDGWVQDSNMKVVDLARRCEDAGVAALIYTDISRDGTLSGPNIPATVSLAESVSIPVILSGGVKTNEHIAELIKARVIEGVIVGRALYEKTLNIRTAIDMCLKTPPSGNAPTSGDIW